MTISTTDIKLRTPERLTDLADGGGRQTSGTIVDAMPEPQRSIATEALYAPHYSRSSPMLAVLAHAMGWSSADVDERFAAAAARVV